MDEENLRIQQQIAMLESNAKNCLDKDALSRFGNIKTANPERALQVAIVLNQIAQGRQLKERMSDEQLKDLLRNMQGDNKEFNFIRK